MEDAEADPEAAFASWAAKMASNADEIPFRDFSVACKAKYLIATMTQTVCL